MGGLLVTRGQGDVRARVAAKGHVLVHGPDAAMEICVDVYGSCYHRRLRRCPSSGLASRDMMAFEDHPATGAMTIWVIYNAAKVMMLSATAKSGSIILLQPRLFFLIT